MKRYLVTVPIAGVACLYAEVPDDASDDDIYRAAVDSFDPKADDIEWEFHKQLTRGNVSHFSTNEWSYEEDG